MIRRTVVAITLVAALLLVSSARAEEPAPSLEQRLDRLVLDAYPSATEPGAAVLVMVDGKAVLRKGYGMADVEKGVKVTPDMIFRIGSITKQFTAVCVLKLVEQGKVSLEDEITKYLPDFDMRGKAITVENLLSHTSGLPNYTEGMEYQEGMTRELKPGEIVALVAGKPLEFDPGTQFKYSNTNYALLGMLIEKVSGKSYAEYLEASIAKPLGLADTRYSRDDSLTPRHARGYGRDQADNWVPARPLSMTQPFAAGAIESTVDDLAKWTQALADGKVVDAKLLERAWTPFKTSERPSDYGFGWFIRTEPGERWIGHNGGINGFQSAAVWIPEKKVFVAILRNGIGAGTPSDLVLRQLALEAVGRPNKPRVAITLDEKTLDKYVGVYEASPKFKFTVTREGGTLYIQATNQQKAPVFAEAEGKFFAKVVDAQFEFHVDGDRATSLTLHQNGRKLPAKRGE